MEVTLTPRAEELLRELADLGPLKQIIELALDRLVAGNVAAANRMTPKEAVDCILQLSERKTLDGLSVKDLINEGRKY